MAIFQTVLNRGRLMGYLIGFGAILAEAIYCAIPLFGVSSLDKEHVVFDVLYLVFIPILFFLGVLAIKNRKKGIEPQETDPVDIQSEKPLITPAPKKRGYVGQTIYGFLLCASNPMTFFFWVQATILLQKNQWITDDIPVVASFYLGVPIGTFILYFCFAQLAHYTRRRISPLLRIRLNIFIGGVFIFLSGYLLLTFLELKGYVDLPSL